MAPLHLLPVTSIAGLSKAPGCLAGPKMSQRKLACLLSKVQKAKMRFNRLKLR